MALKVNLRHLESDEVRLEGTLDVAQLDIDPHDKVIRVEQPLDYDLTVEKMEGGLLVQGRLRLVLACQCVRCLKAFDLPLVLENWATHVPLDGEDQAQVVNDCVDLTPAIREDILLEFPHHPLCDPECRGLPKSWAAHAAPPPADRGSAESGGASAWSPLNKLKF
jgi:uncharacterized protein